MENMRLRAQSWVSKSIQEAKMLLLDSEPEVDVATPKGHALDGAWKKCYAAQFDGARSVCCS